MSPATGRLTVRAPSLLVAILALLASPFSLGAQKVTESHWTLDDSHGSFCVWYLVDPALAPALVDRGTVLAPAGTGSTLPANLAQTIRDEPRFNTWIPAAICMQFVGTVTIDGEKPIKASSDGPIAVVSHFISAQSPKGVGPAQYLLIGLLSSNRFVRGEAGDRGLSVDGVTVYSGKDRGGPEDRVDLRLAGAMITWVGHPAGEASVGTTQPMSFGYAGARSTIWQGKLEMSPEDLHPMTGGLRVAGNSSLAKALRASPIRDAGPLSLAGTGRLTFQIAPPRGSGGN